jgi:dephospho-CoA kinase
MPRNGRLSVVGFQFSSEFRTAGRWRGSPVVVVGLTGGIATGKSAVAAMFAARGAAVVDADRITHALQEPGQPCYREIVKAFGTEILDQAGRIDRRRLGALVFADPAVRRQLESIMHPAIREACQAEIRAAEAANRRVCVVDAALILETGQQHRFQVIVLVSAPEDVQVSRLVHTRGLTEAEARRRIRSQWPTAAKAGLADFVIDNGGDLATTEAQVSRVYAALERASSGGDFSR